MAIIGRIECPLGDNPAAHVKQNPHKNPYIHCPECGFMGHAKNGTQKRLMLAKMRPEGGAAPTPPATLDPIIVKGGARAAAPAPAPEPTAPAAPVKRAGFWDQLAGKA